MDHIQFCCHDVFQCEGWWWITFSFAVMTFSIVKDGGENISFAVMMFFSVKVSGGNMTNCAVMTFSSVKYGGGSHSVLLS